MEAFDLPACIKQDIENMDFGNLISSVPAQQISRQQVQSGVNADDAASKSYQYFVDQNMKLQQENHRYGIMVSQLQSELNQWKLKCQQKDSSIHSLQSQLLQQQQTFDSKFNEFLVCANDYDQKKSKEILQLKSKCQHLTTTLSTIYKKYDDLKGEYNKLHSTYFKLRHNKGNNTINPNDYKSWTWSNVYEWIINDINDERLTKYEKDLFANLKKEDISGKILPQLNEDDLYYLGIKNYFDRQLLLSHINKLVDGQNGKRGENPSPVPAGSVSMTTSERSIPTISVISTPAESPRSHEFKLPSPRSTLSSAITTCSPSNNNQPVDTLKKIQMDCNIFPSPHASQQAATQIAVAQIGSNECDTENNMNNMMGLRDHFSNNSMNSSMQQMQHNININNGIEHHKQFTVEQLKKIRIRQKNIVYVVGLPVNLCNAKLLKSSKWFGKYGTISRICFNTSPKCVKANSIPTFVTYTNEFDACQAIQKMNLYCLSDGTRLKTNFGRTKYCPTFCEAKQCTNNKCKFLHEWANIDDIITEQEINDFNAIRAGPPSRFNKK